MIAKLVAKNTRDPEAILGDMEAQTEACRLAERELLRLTPAANATSDAASTHRIFGGKVERGLDDQNEPGVTQCVQMCV